jgi:hypothetical protein
MKDSAPFIDSEVPMRPAVDSTAKQVFPGSCNYQVRPSIIKRDSDYPNAYITPMGGADYSYAPARNKKGNK